MKEAGKDTHESTQTVDGTPEDGIRLAEAIKERLSPAVEIWVKLIADVITEEVLRERRAEAA